MINSKTLTTVAEPSVGTAAEPPSRPPGHRPSGEMAFPADSAAIVIAAADRCYHEGVEAARAAFFRDRDGYVCVRKLSALQDRRVRAIWSEFIGSKNPIGFCLLAVGGYGREELFPSSDVDLLAVIADDQDRDRFEANFAEFIQKLWQLGVRTGHALRNASEAIDFARGDLHTSTALLDLRWLAGDARLAADLRRRFREEVLAFHEYDWIKKKQDERLGRLKHFGASRYQLEPNIKEGNGGLRDYHLIHWVSQILIQGARGRKLVCAKPASHGRLLGMEQAPVILQLLPDSRKRDALLGPSLKPRLGRGAGLTLMVPHDLDQALDPPEWRRLGVGYHRLITMRVLLHFVAPRSADRLTFDRQVECAQALHYQDQAQVLAVEQFMGKFFRSARGLGIFSHFFIEALERRRVHGRAAAESLPTASDSSVQCHVIGKAKPDKPSTWFGIHDRRIGFLNAELPKTAPLSMLELFVRAEETNRDLDSLSMRLILRHRNELAPYQDDPRAAELFFKILTGPRRGESNLRMMNGIGLLRVLIPEFAQAFGRMQFNRYHVYTVDEHSIQAVGFLTALATGALRTSCPAAKSVFDQVLNVRVLYLALLLHDAAKGEKDHSAAGALLANEVGKRFGFSSSECDEAAFLVRHHLLLSEVAFKQEIEDRGVIERLCEQLGSVDRLRSLFCLTIADIQAVGPGTWNSWKASLLTRVFQASERFMNGEWDLSSEESQQRFIKAHTLLEGIPHQLHQSLLSNENQAWLMQHDDASFEEEAKFVAEHARSNRPCVRLDLRDGSNHILFCGSDRLRLFADFAAVFDRFDCRILHADIRTLAGGIALDRFYAHDWHTERAISDERRLSRLSRALLDASNGTLPEIVVRPDRTEVPSLTAAASVYINQKASALDTQIEIACNPKSGLVASVAALVAGRGLRISSARIARYGERFACTYRVRTRFGLKPSGGREMRLLEEELRKLLDEGIFVPPVPLHEKLA